MGSKRRDQSKIQCDCKIALACLLMTKAALQKFDVWPNFDVEIGFMQQTYPELSRRALLRLAAGASTAMLTSRLPAAWGRGPQGRAASATFQNPLFAGDYPDPTILRVGGDFYMTHTSYSYAPGLVVWHSRDLVNWTPISHAPDGYK